MGLKEFNADLRAARSSKEATTARETVGIFDLERGDSDGQLGFQYTHGALSHPLSIQVVAKDPVNYPQNNSYYLYIIDDIGGDDEDQVPRVLNNLSPSLKGKSIDDIFPVIADKLNTRLDGHNLSNDEEDQDDFGDFENFASDANSSDYGDLGLEPYEEQAKATPDTIRLTGTLEMQKKDLAAATMAGVSFGVYDFCDSYYGTMSLSIPAQCWGLSSETLEAWDLSESDHVVLLIKACEGGYPSAAEFLDGYRQRNLYRFALGKCSKAKPSEQSVHWALRDQSSREETVSPAWDAMSEVADAQFRPLYLFNSIEKILQNDLNSLIKLRINDENLSWSEALTRHLSGPECVTPEDRQKLLLDLREPRILYQHAMSSVETMSIPLVAMNCAVYLMVHCGQHCVICGRPFEAGFETRRPYVCDRDLCLDHYFSLNLGPGIEHDIINNPHTVDLLVSFFYSALLSGRVLQFPLALRLKGPGRIPTVDDSDVEARIQYDEGLGRATFLESLIGRQKEWMKVGAKVILLATTPKNLAQQEGPPSLAPPSPSNEYRYREYKPRQLVGPWYYNSKRYLCSILEANSTSFTFKVITSWTRENPGPEVSAHVTGPVPQQNGRAQPSTQADDVAFPDQMIVLPYIQDMSGLSEVERNPALATILCGLPSILSLRKYLLDNPGHRLSSSNHFLDSTTYRLLLWIVASNRSFIVQDEPVSAGVAEGNLSSSNAPNRVLGVGSDWLQFRFVQGSPEKENRFAKEVEKLSQSTGDDRAPTLFAWHGSGVQNWHGIVSTGLNFNQVLNGRAHGHGVYLSQAFNVSMGYAAPGLRQTWPNSDLNVSQAISMCEVVNKTEAFVATQPHLVVNQVDWIQCRFLFARVNPTAAAVDPQVSFPQGRKLVGEPGSSGYYDDLSIRGPSSESVKVPKSAIPSRLKETVTQGRGGQTAKRRSGTKKRTTNIQNSTGQEEDIGVDLDGILIEEQDNQPQGAETPLKRQKGRSVTTDFEPGTLDWESIPKLPDPLNPSSSAQKVLMQEFKSVSKAQESTDLVERGWHIDFSKLENMFHWVVELHSFDKDLPLAQDMKKKGCKSVVLELNFGSTYPMAPPFARIIRPRFLEFAHGGGGNVTQGGSICSQMLVTEGWAPTLGIEKVILQIRLQLCDTERPARLKFGESGADSDYTVAEALEAYKRAATQHGWSISADLNDMAAGWARKL